MEEGLRQPRQVGTHLDGINDHEGGVLEGAVGARGRADREGAGVGAQGRRVGGVGGRRGIILVKIVSLKMLGPLAMHEH